MPEEKKSLLEEKYWAAKPAKEIGCEIERKVEEFDEHLRESGRWELYKRVYENLYMADLTKGRIYTTGEQDEFVNVDVADFSNIIQHLTVMTTSQRPAFQPKAANTDHKSIAQTVLAGGLLDYYMREKKVERFTNKATRYGVSYGEGFVRPGWNPSLGADYVAKEGRTIKEGDIQFRNYLPWNVIRDFTTSGYDECHWWVFRDFIDINILAGRHPELAEQIYEVSGWSDGMNRIDLIDDIKDQTDLIPVYTLIHDKNEAMPEGRMTSIVSPEIILTDGPLPFETPPVYRIAPMEQDECPFGWTVAFDLLPLCEALQKLYSTVATNHANFGVQNILAPKGHGMSVEEITEGLNLIEYDPAVGPPAPLNLLNTPKEIFEFIQMIERKIETLSGINAVARGNPSETLGAGASGASMALVQSLAIQFNSGLQQSYAQLMEDVGTGIIKILRNYASNKRVAHISGESKRQLMKEWTGKDLSLVNRVLVDIGNPMSRTTAGRVQMAEALLGANMIENPDQYIQVLTTGTLEPMIEGKQAELLAIRSENEELSDGKPQVAVATDNHQLHIIEHKSVLASPEARRDPELVKVVLAHLQEHVGLLRSTDPILLSLMGQTPPPPQAGTGAPPGAAAEGGNGGVPELPMEPGPAAQEAGVELPGMPNNPMTGQDFNQETGGM